MSSVQIVIRCLAGEGRVYLESKQGELPIALALGGSLAAKGVF